tara:strand:- start:25910 stop:26938 length:1029 start_codon:yes stop_codon:yes gene_type:complete
MSVDGPGGFNPYNPQYYEGLTGRSADGPSRAQDVPDTYASSGASQAQGTFQGEEVHMHNSAGELQDAFLDATEEFTSMGSQKSQEKASKSEKLKQRKVDHALNNLVEKVKDADLAQKYIDRFPDIKNNRNFQEFPNILRRMSDPDWEDILKEANQRFPDAAHRHAALSFAYEVLSREGEKSLALAAKVKTAIEGMMQDKELAVKVRAGYNITAEAAKLVDAIREDSESDMGDVSIGNLKEFYQGTLEGDESKTITDLYNQIYDQGKAGNFVDYLEIAIKLTGEDLRSSGPMSLGPSRPKAWLENHIDTLYQVQTLGNTRKGIITLLGRVDALPGVTISPPAA